MPLYLRKLLFFSFFAVFLLAAPLVVLYTAGYRINQTTGRIQRTGVLAISTLPKGASVTIGGEALSSRTPAVVQRIMPDEYTIRLEKKGYIPWEQKVTVESGRTTYVTGYLFADNDPELLVEEYAVAVTPTNDGSTAAMLVKADNEYEIWTYSVSTRTQRILGTVSLDETIAPTIQWSINEDAVVIMNNAVPVVGIRVSDGSAIAASELDALINLAPEISFVNNGANIEVRTTSLLSLLPLSSYTVIDRWDDNILLTDTRGKTLLLSLTTGAVSEIDMPNLLIDWNEDSGLYLASDGNEIDVVNLITGKKELIARQSTPLIDVLWHPSGGVVFSATSDTLFATETARYEGRVATPLVQGVHITDVWIDDNSAWLIFAGTVNDISGLYRLKLVR